LHCEAEPLVAAEFFPASIPLLFFVLLSVSLLKKVGKNIRKSKRKYPLKLRITFIISTLIVHKKTPVKRWNPPGVLKKQKMKPQHYLLGGCAAVVSY
jgi:hypothetical protein